MTNFKSGLINCIGTIFSIPILILLIIFSSLHGTNFEIVLYTLFGSFSLLYFLFSTLQNWIKNQTCQSIFQRFVHIFIILILFIIFVLLTFLNIPLNLKYVFLYLATGITAIMITFFSIWKQIPQILISILSILIFILCSIFLFLLIF